MASDKEDEVDILQGVVVTSMGVKVWSTIGIKVPVPDLDFTMAELSFGHERWAKNSTQEEIRKTSVLVDEFNTDFIDKKLPKFLKAIRRIDSEVSGETGIDSPRRSKKQRKKDVEKGSVQDRARRRIREAGG